ncbi:MAG: phosphopantothenoylcysteine decarboxylase [Candidatus Omnitrophica bacterium]|nr:phosphopantothenoylcysteine decarboxylase [Candidatus Omnitrophota bacterium]
MKILITAGPTREFIDPVRFISNPATGKLGYILAKKAKDSGHSVTLISGPAYLKCPEGVKIISVLSAMDMFNAVLKNFPLNDALIMSAAVSDWGPEKKHSEKLKKKSSWNLKLVPNPDILKNITKIKKENQLVAGFALESSHLLENGWKKMKEKNMDMVIINDVSYFGQGDKKSRVFILFPDKTIENCTGFTKIRLSSIILKRIENLFEQKQIINTQ